MERLGAQRRRNQENRDQQKLDAGTPLKPLMTPEERKAARKQADRVYRKNKRAHRKTAGLLNVNPK